MLERIRKHQTWLWILLTVVVIVTFVIFFTPGVTRIRGIPGVGQVGSIAGRTVTAQEYLKALQEENLAFFLQYGQWPEGAVADRFRFDPTERALQRLTLLYLAEKAGIEVGDEAIVEWVRQVFGDPDRPESARERYQQFVNSPEIRRRGYTPRIINEFIRHQVMISHLVRTASLYGELVVPREAREQYRRLHESIQAEAVIFEATNYWDQVKPTQEELLRYYSNHVSRYRIPERRVVWYVKFPITNYLAKAEEELNTRTNLQVFLEQEYQRRGTNSFTDVKGNPLPPEEAKKRIFEELKQRQALILARRAAAEFGSKLFDMKPVKPDNLVKLAKQEKIPVYTTRPFNESIGPLEFQASRTMIQRLFELNETRPFTTPLVGEDAVYICALKERLPSEVPPFDAVKTQVERDYHLDKARELAQEAGRKFRNRLQEEMKAGKSFRQVCEEAKVPIVSLPKFDLVSGIPEGWEPRLNFYQVRSVAAQMRKGEVSDFIPTRDGGFILHVIDRIPVSEKELAEALPDYLKQLRMQGRMSAFPDWFQYQMQVNEVNFPILQRENQNPTQ